MTEYEMEIDVEVTITCKVLFTPCKEEKMTRHYPGSPACIEDLGVKSIVFPRMKMPLERKGDLYVMEEREVPLNLQYKKVDLDNELNFLIMGAMTDDEWAEQCLESLK